MQLCLLLLPVLLISANDDTVNSWDALQLLQTQDNEARQTYQQAIKDVTDRNAALADYRKATTGLRTKITAAQNKFSKAFAAGDPSQWDPKKHEKML